MAAKKKVKNSRKNKLISNSRYPGTVPSSPKYGLDDVDPALIADYRRNVILAGGVLEQQCPAVVPAGISQGLLLDRSVKNRSGKRALRYGPWPLSLRPARFPGWRHGRHVQDCLPRCPACPIPCETGCRSDRFSACSSSSSAAPRWGGSSGLNSRLKGVPAFKTRATQSSVLVRLTTNGVDARTG